MFTLLKIKNNLVRRFLATTREVQSRFAKLWRTMLEFWRTHRKSILAFGLVLIVAGVLLPNINLAHAEAAAAPSQDDGQKLLNAITPILRVMRSLLWPFLLLIGNLLQNDILFGSGMEQTLLKVWVQVRDIVNILFVLILVGIALYNVVGGFQQDFHVKAVLPKFIIGLILVNFTFLGVKVVLDGINVISTGIFALPQAVGITLQQEQIEDKLCRAMYTNDKGKYAPTPTSDGKKLVCLNQTVKGTVNGKEVDLAKFDRKNNTDLADLNGYFNTINSRNVAVVLALNFEQIGQIGNIADGLNDTEKGEIKNLVANVLLSVILYIIYGSAFIALFVVLLVRMIVLWIMIVLSPLIVLMWVLPGELKSMMGGGGDDIKGQFIKHAIVPIPVAISLAIGTVMLTALNSSKFPTWALNQSTWGMNLFTSGISTFQQLLTAVACVGFIWKAVFDAMKDTQASGITDGIKNFVGGMGKSIAKLPLMAPMFPIDAGGKRASVMDIFLGAKNIPNLVDQQAHEHSRETFSAAYGNNDKAVGAVRTSANLKDLKKNIRKVSAADFAREANQKALHGYFKDHPNELPTMVGKYTDSKTFLEDLEKGNVQPNDMKLLGDRLGYVDESKAGAAKTAAQSEASKKLKKALMKGKSGKDAEAEADKLVAAYEQKQVNLNPDEKKVMDAAIKSETVGAPAAGILQKLAKPEEPQVAVAKQQQLAGLLDQISAAKGQNAADKAATLTAVEEQLKGMQLNEEEKTRMQGFLKASYSEAEMTGAGDQVKKIYTPPTPPPAPKAAGGAKPAAPAPSAPVTKGAKPTFAVTAKGEVVDGWTWNGKEWV